MTESSEVTINLGLDMPEMVAVEEVYLIKRDGVYLQGVYTAFEVLAIPDLQIGDMIMVATPRQHRLVMQDGGRSK